MKELPLKKKKKKKNVSTSSHTGDVVNSNPYSVSAYVQKKKKNKRGKLSWQNLYRFDNMWYNAC